LGFSRSRAGRSGAANQESESKGGKEGGLKISSQVHFFSPRSETKPSQISDEIHFQQHFCIPGRNFIVETPDDCTSVILS
jgi:hypothetical protein